MKAGEGNLSLRKLTILLWRHRIAILSVGSLVFLLAIIWTSITPRRYQSQAKLLVRLGRENATLDPTSTLGQGPAIAVPNSREEEINSVIEIVQSRPLLEHVVDTLTPEVIVGNNRADRARAMHELASNLSVYAVKKSTIINIEYTAPSESLANSVIATLIEGFLEQHGKLYRTPAGYAFLEEQAHRVQNNLHDKEDEYHRLKDTTGLYSVKEQRENLVKQIGALQQALLEAESTLAGVQVEVSHLKKKLADLPVMQITARTQGGPGIDNARTQLHALQLKEKELLAKFGEKYRELSLIIEQREEAERILASEEKAVELTTTGPNKASDEAELALLRQEASVAALEAKIPVLQEQLRTQTDKLKSFDENSVALDRLRRDVELNEALYRKYCENVEQGLIDKSLNAERISNISIAQGASSDGTPVRPRWALNLALGSLMAVAIGLAVGIVLERLKPSQEAPQLPHWLLRLI
jgi:uncharacterized protein involved in exopolysaccharide biosynthesis